MAAAEAPARRRRALLVATARYADPGLAALRAPTGDVDALAGVLGDGSIGGFAVVRLVDRPTEQIKKEIESFFDDASPQDLLLLYVSGHGVLSQSRRFYFATSTTALRYLRATAVEDSFVNDVMQHSRARSIVLVLDCCHSGAFGRGLVPKSPLTVDVEHRFEGRGRVTMSASTELEYAFEESETAAQVNPHAPGSLFTRCLVEGLATGDADIDADGRISVDELYDYVCGRMRELTAHQTPGLAGDVRGDIVIAHSRRVADLPADLRQAIDSPLAGVREGAVAELESLLRSTDAGIAKAAKAELERLTDDDSQRVASRARAVVRPTPAPPPRPRRRGRIPALRAVAANRPRWRLRPTRRRLAAILFAIVALGGAAAAVTLGGGDERSSTPTTAAERRLLALIPASTRPACNRSSSEDPRADATLSCDVASTLTATYLLFRDRITAGDWFAQSRADEDVNPSSGNCANTNFMGQTDYRVGGRVAGSYFCFIRDDKPSLYAVDRRANVGVIAEVFHGGGNVAREKLVDLWSHGVRIRP